MTSTSYLVLGSKSWNRRIFDEELRPLPGTWRFVDSPAGLTSALLQELRPRYLFFLHWSWKVPAETVRDFECVCFHMTDVPFGRGGSPLQNLISRGVRETKVTALRMTAEFDAGPVYGKQPLSLEGAAEEILIRATYVSATMIKAIIRDKPVPQPQHGTPTVFQRRTPGQSQIGSADSLAGLHDFIRMLDAEGYPRAFLRHGGFRYEFSRAVRYDGRIVADVVITPDVPVAPSQASLPPEP